MALSEKLFALRRVEKEMNSPATKRVQMFAIEIEHMTGKLVNEK